MKNLKNIGRRSISLFLVFVLCISMLNLTVFADTDVKLPKVEIASQNEAGVTIDGPDGTSINGKKTIKEVTGTPDEFDITLTVETVSKSTTTTTSKAADVVLVLDVTESMDYSTSTGTRWSDMKSAVDSFVEQLLPAGNTATRVSIIIYAGDYYQLCDWETDADTVKATYQNASDSDALRSYISSGKKQDYQGTNCSAGFLGADVQLDSARADALQYVVYMTDGDANTYYDNAKATETTLTCTKEEHQHQSSCYRSWKLTCTKQEHTHRTSCYSYTTSMSAVASNSGSVTWEGNNTDNYSSNAAIKQAAQLKANHSSATLIAVGFGTSVNNKVVSKTTNTSLDQSYTTSSSLNFTTILTNISTSITDATAQVVTDHMSDYVTYMKVINGKGGTYSEGDKVLSWDLSKAEPVTTTAGDYTTKTYTLTYRVKVDRTDEFYAAVKKDGSVPTNGDTTLPYTLGDESGTLNFDVPYVKSDLPTVLWHIEYYKQTGVDEESGEKIYKLADESYKIEGTFGDTVTLASKDQYYTTKYANYTCVKADASINLSATGENVIKVYYDRDIASVTVNHYYKTINADGTVRNWPETPDLSPVIETTVYVGDPYTATEQLTFNGAEYTFDHGDKTIKSLAKTGNVINLYYIRDERDPASVSVDHVYRLHTWTLVDGTYVLVNSEFKAENVQMASGLKATDIYAVSNVPTDDYEDYEPAEDNVTQITLTAGQNKVTQHFDMTVDDRGNPIEVTVVHHYTKYHTYVDENGTARTDITNGTFTVGPETKYVGEKFVVEEVTMYENEEYTPAANNSKGVNSLPCSMTINLYYSLETGLEPTTVTVNHIYQTVTHETVPTYEEVTEDVESIDEETGEIVIDVVTKQVVTGSEVVALDPVTDATVERIVENVYEGQNYTAPVEGRSGYECVTDVETRTEVVKANGETVINVYYIHDEDADNRSDASIDVMHVYTTHLTTIVGGEVKTVDITGEPAFEYYVGKTGDEYAATPVYEDLEGNTGYTLVGNPTLTKVLHKGTNSTIVINYERSVEQLSEKVDYTVNYEYYTRSMTVVNGVAVWSDPVLDTETTKDSTGGNGYIGQKITLETGAEEGYYPYTAYGNNPSVTQYLMPAGNTYTFRYVKDEPLPQVTLTVRHHITTKTITLQGESTFTQDVELPVVFKYVGESFTAEPLPGFNLILVRMNGSLATVEELTNGIMNGNVTVDFGYEIVNDYRTPATYSVQHIYKVIDWDGSVASVNEPEAKVTETYAYTTANTTASVADGYKLVEMTFNGRDVMTSDGAYSFTVTTGENKVVYVYETRTDSRPLTSAKVIHEYYANEAAMETGAEATREEIATDRRATAEFTAEPITENGGRAYAVYGNPTLTITLKEAASENVITIRYIRAETTYQVIHEYYTDDEFTGSTSSTAAGKAGDVIAAGDIAKATTYGGNNYSYTSASADLTLVQGENGAITLRYDRTTTIDPIVPNPVVPTPSDNDDNDDDDYTPPAEVIEPEDVPLVETPAEEPAEEEEIVSEDVPLVETPVEEPVEEEEIIPEDVPLSEVPKTSDLSSLWYTMALLSACGLAAMALLKKREK